MPGWPELNQSSGQPGSLIKVVWIERRAMRGVAQAGIAVNDADRSAGGLCIDMPVPEIPWQPLEPLYPAKVHYHASPTNRDFEKFIELPGQHTIGIYRCRSGQKGTLTCKYEAVRHSPVNHWLQGRTPGLAQPQFEYVQRLIVGKFSDQASRLSWPCAWLMPGL